jgi:hypothetical protein
MLQLFLSEGGIRAIITRCSSEINIIEKGKEKENGLISLSVAVYARILRLIVSIKAHLPRELLTSAFICVKESSSFLVNLTDAQLRPLKAKEMALIIKDVSLVA